MQQLERQDLLDLVTEHIYENQNGEITPTDVQLVLNALITSVVVIASDSLGQLPAITPGSSFAQGTQGVREVDGRLRLFKALFGLDPGMFGGAIPLPTGLVTDQYWREVSPEGNPYLGYQVVARQLLVNLLDDEQVVPGRLYYVSGGGGAGRDVLVRGLAPQALELDGYVVVAATPQLLQPSYYAARLDVRVSHAEPLGAEAITRAQLLARLADRPQLLVGKLYAISRPAVGSDPLLTVFASFDTPASRVCEAARRSDQPGLWRYDLTADTLQPVVVAVLQAAYPLRFTHDGDYENPTGSFALDLTGAQRGRVVRLLLSGVVAAPVLPATCKVKGGHLTNAENVYYFRYVSPTRVEVTITQFNT